MAEGMASTDHFVTRCKATGKVCKVCGDDDPFHVHNGDERIEEYFTIGRGMTDIAAAREWQRRAVERGRALEVERRRTAALADEMTTMVRDRDHLDALYEAAMNWFDDDEWQRFEESEEFRTANAVASLDAGEPEHEEHAAENGASEAGATASDAGLRAKSTAPASVEGEPDRMGLSGNLRIKSDSLVAEGFSGGGDGRPDRYTFTHDKSLGIFAEFADDGFVYAPKPFLMPAEARARVVALWAVPVDREARIERVSAALRALPTYGFGLADVGIPGCAAAAVDALSGVVSSGEATDELEREGIAETAHDKGYADGLLAVLADPEAAMRALPEDVQQQHRDAIQSVVDARRSAALHGDDVLGGPSSGLPDEPNEVREFVADVAGGGCDCDEDTRCYACRAEDLLVAYRVDALPEREDGILRFVKRERDDFAERLGEARAEVERLNRPGSKKAAISALRSVAMIEQQDDGEWFAPVNGDDGDTFETCAEALKATLDMTRAEGARAAVPLSTDVLRNPTEELSRRVAVAIGGSGETHGAAAAIGAVLAYLESQPPPSPAGEVQRMSDEMWKPAPATVSPDKPGPIDPSPVGDDGELDVPVRLYLFDGQTRQRWGFRIADLEGYGALPEDAIRNALKHFGIDQVEWLRKRAGRSPSPAVGLTVEDRERLMSALGVHVRPIYAEAIKWAVGPESKRTAEQSQAWLDGLIDRLAAKGGDGGR